jgi:glycosyltransferase involved in cell wall biosynthesis
VSQLVSVVIPTYNRRQFIVAAIESVLAQTYQPLEIIVADDGSTDGTAEELRRFGKRVRYLAQPNRSASAARNLGIRAAAGEYIALLDSDDLWAPAKIEKQVALLERHPEVGVIYCQGHTLYMASGESHPLRYEPELRGDLRRRLLFGNCVTGSASAVLIRSACFEKVGFFDETLRSAEDWEMWIRISRHFQFDSVPEPLVTIRSHGSNKSKKIETIFAHQLKIVESALRDDPVDGGNAALRRRILAYYHWSAGVEYLWAARYSQSACCLSRAIWLWPFERRETAFLYRAPRSHLIAALRGRKPGRAAGSVEAPVGAEPSATV